jgi:hypothetical protein
MILTSDIEGDRCTFPGSGLTRENPRSKFLGLLLTIELFGERETSEDTTHEPRERERPPAEDVEIVSVDGSELMDS